MIGSGIIFSCRPDKTKYFVRRPTVLKSSVVKREHLRDEEKKLSGLDWIFVCVIMGMSKVILRLCYLSSFYYLLKILIIITG